VRGLIAEGQSTSKQKRSKGSAATAIKQPHATPGQTVPSDLFQVGGDRVPRILDFTAASELFQRVEDFYESEDESDEDTPLGGELLQSIDTLSSVQSFRVRSFRCT